MVDINKLLLIAVAGLTFLIISDITSKNVSRTEKLNASEIMVKDGDTVDAKILREEYTVRLQSVDTPELNSENTPGEYGLKDSPKTRSCLKRYADKARDFLRNETEGTVKVITRWRVGDYGRLLAYLGENRSINRKLVHKGYARVYRSQSTEQVEILRLEREAKNKNKGIWSCGTDK